MHVETDSGNGRVIIICDDPEQAAEIIGAAMEYARYGVVTLTKEGDFDNAKAHFQLWDDTRTALTALGIDPDGDQNDEPANEDDGGEGPGDYMPENGGTPLSDRDRDPASDLGPLEKLSALSESDEAIQ